MELKFKAQRKSSEEWNYLDLGEYLTRDEKEQPDMLQYLHRNICQYTGLKDEVGIEIYEGDVLSKKWIAEVYKNNEGTYMVRFHTNPKVNKPQSLFSYLKKREKAGTSDRDCIKIGNIHDNPELLSTI